uniref:Integrase_H2C2 domain-containing protein n=1 Tax=Heligmosomoides polygyrus TaxID=6339 RepID=A0A183G9U9_HELPZ
MQHCVCTDGVCTLSDGSVLVWTPAKEENCAFIPVGKMKGLLLGTVWINDSNEFALSWREDSPTIYDCDSELTISDQGNNVLTALPPRTIDYGERVLMVKDEAINILSVFPDPSPNEKSIAVRVAELTTLKPVTETFVPCYTSRLVETPVMLVAQSSQLQDTSIMVTSAILRSADVPEQNKTRWLQLAENCTNQRNGCLYYKLPDDRRAGTSFARLFLPAKSHEPVFLVLLRSSSSADGHFNWRKTLPKITRKYYWPQMAEDIFKLAKSCDECQRKRTGCQPREADPRGKKSLHFAKYAIATPLPDCTAVTVAHPIMTECTLKGAGHSDRPSPTDPTTLLDPVPPRGKRRLREIFATFHPTLQTYISEDQLDWDNYVAACTFLYNTSVHASANNTPFFLVFGRAPVFNIDLLSMIQSSTSQRRLYLENVVTTLHSAWRLAARHNEAQRRKLKEQYDKSHLSPLSIRVGDRVYLLDFAPKQA